MKLKTNIILILTVIVILSGAIFALSFVTDKTDVNIEDIAETDTSVVVLDIKEDIKSYKYTSADEEFEILKEKFWYVENNDDIDLNQQNVLKMLSVISKLSTTNLVEEDAKDLSKYGLDSPSSIIEVTDYNDVKYIIKTGMKTSTDSGHYSTINDDNKVFIMSDEDYQIICGGLDSLRNKEVVSIKGDIVRVSIKNPSANMTIAYKESENLNAGTFTSWEMITPYKKDVNKYIFEENVLKALNFQAENFVDDKPLDYGIYGLDNPECYVEVITTENHYIFYFGKTSEDGKVYFKTDDKPNVYSVNKDLVKFKDFTPVYLLESLVFSRNISAVDTINFTAKKISVTKINNETYTVDGSKVDEEKVREAYLAIISPVIQGEVDDAKVGDEICRFTFDYNTDTPSETVIYYQYEKMYAAASVNGIIEFYVKKSYVDDMINAISNLSE